MNPTCDNPVATSSGRPAPHAPPVSIAVIAAIRRPSNTAPFGMPVVPEVNTTVSEASGSFGDPGGSAPSRRTSRRMPATSSDTLTRTTSTPPGMPSVRSSVATATSGASCASSVARSGAGERGLIPLTTAPRRASATYATTYSALAGSASAEYVAAPQAPAREPRGGLVRERVELRVGQRARLVDERDARREPASGFARDVGQDGHDGPSEYAPAGAMGPGPATDVGAGHHRRARCAVRRGRRRRATDARRPPRRGARAHRAGRLRRRRVRRGPRRAPRVRERRGPVPRRRTRAVPRDDRAPPREPSPAARARAARSRRRGRGDRRAARRDGEPALGHVDPAPAARAGRAAPCAAGVGALVPHPAARARDACHRRTDPSRRRRRADQRVARAALRRDARDVRDGTARVHRRAERLAAFGRPSRQLPPALVPGVARPRGHDERVCVAPPRPAGAPTAHAVATLGAEGAVPSRRARYAVRDVPGRRARRDAPRSLDDARLGDEPRGDALLGALGRRRAPGDR